MSINHQSPFERICLTGASIVVVAGGLKIASAIVVPVLLAAFIAIICAAPIRWLTDRGVPKLVSVIGVLVVLILLTLVLLVIVGHSLHDFLKDYPVYRARMADDHRRLQEWVADIGGSRVDLEYLDPSLGLDVITRALNGLGNLFANGFLILLIVVFMLLENAEIPNKLRALSSWDDSWSSSLQSAEKITHEIRRYMVIKAWVSALTGTVIAGWLAILGIDYWILWGVVAFLLNFIPNIGSVIAALPAVVMAYVQLGAQPAIFAAMGFVAVNVVFGNFVEPRVMGRGLDMSTLIVFLSLIFWGWIFGPVGMLLSVPLTMVIKIAAASSPETEWLAILLGSGRALNQEDGSKT